MVTDEDYVKMESPTTGETIYLEKPSCRFCGATLEIGDQRCSSCGREQR